MKLTIQMPSSTSLMPTRGMVGDSQRVAILAVAEPELAFEIGAPQLVGTGSCRQLGTGGTASGPADRLDQAVPVQDRVDGALGRHAHVAVQSPQQQFADLAGAPVRLLALQGDDQPPDL